MQKPTLCVIFEAIGPYNAIGRVAYNDIRIALEAGWQVTVVAKRLDETLHDRVEWLKLYVPPRLFLLQWATARWFMKRALGDRQFDVVHAHQPQAASLADIFQCHFLTRMAHRCNALEKRPGLRSALIRAQEMGVLPLEDYYYRHWNPKTRMLYDSAMTCRDFHTLYGNLPREQVMVYSFPKANIPTTEERKEAKRKLIGFEPEGPVVGYLGGLHERKGYRRLIAGLEGDHSVFLMLGGQYSEGYQAPGLEGRYKAFGLVKDNATFYAACDVFVVPSLYEPLGLVAFEAVARGVPVITSERVGALTHLEEYGMGIGWKEGEPLVPLIYEMAGKREALLPNARRMASDLGVEHYTERLLALYEEALRENRGEGKSLSKDAVSLRGET